MPNPPRKIAFVTAATEHGTLIVHRLDYHMTAPDRGYGVGFQLLESSTHDRREVDMVVALLDLRRQYYGNGVVAVDCGANIGVHAIEWARHMTGWGAVLAIEAQERIYYALAGNIALNNCFNARAIHAAIADRPGTMKIPVPDYLSSASFGSLELRRRENTEFIGQPIAYSEDRMVDVQTITLDSLPLPRIDVIKIDIEGMELDALAGAAQCIGSKHPIILVETIKVDKNRLRQVLENFGYAVFESGMYFLCVHKGDKCLAHIKLTE